MNKYLLEILKIENTVIIPGLGAIMVTNSKTGAFMFNPHLKFNDKTLEKYVEVNSNMDAQEAANFVSKFAREILADLDKGEKHTIFGLGSFIKNGDEIEFIPDTDQKDEKKETVVPKPVQEPTPEPKKTEAKNSYTEATAAKDNIAKKANDVPEKVEKKTEEKPVEKPVPVPKKPVEKEIVEEKKKEKIVPPVSASADEKKAALEKAGMAPTKTMEKTQKDKKPKKGIGKWILLIFLLLLGLSAAYIGVNWDEYQYRLGFAKTEEHKDQHNTKDSTKDAKDETNQLNDDAADENDMEHNLGDSTDVNAETNDDSQETVEPIVEDVVETKVAAEETPVKVVETSDSFKSNGSTGGNGDYHVVVGLFSDASNATRLVSKLKGENHNALILGTFDGLQMVIVKSFSSREDAIGSMREVRSSIEDRAWVFKY